jgi:hypothetical protein
MSHHTSLLSCLFKTRFLSLTLRPRNAVTWFSFIDIYINITPPFCNFTPELRVSVLSFISGAFSLAGCLFPFCIQAKSCFSALLFFSKYVVRVAPLSGPLAPRLAASTAAHLSSSRKVPWPLVLRLLASAELLLYRTSLPHLIISRTI